MPLIHFLHSSLLINIIIMAGTTGVSGSCVRGEWTAGRASRPRWYRAAGVCARPPRRPAGRVRVTRARPSLAPAKVVLQWLFFPLPPSACLLLASFLHVEGLCYCYRKMFWEPSPLGRLGGGEKWSQEGGMWGGREEGEGTTRDRKSHITLKLCLCVFSFLFSLRAREGVKETNTGRGASEKKRKRKKRNECLGCRGAGGGQGEVSSQCFV